MLGEYADKEGMLVSGVIQQSADPRNVHVDVGDVEALLPSHEQVPTETYTHGERLRGYVLTVARGARAHRSRCPAPTPAWCASCSKWKCQRSPTAPWRS